MLTEQCGFLNDATSRKLKHLPRVTHILQCQGRTHPATPLSPPTVPSVLSLSHVQASGL